MSCVRLVRGIVVAVLLAGCGVDDLVATTTGSCGDGSPCEGNRVDGEAERCELSPIATNGGACEAAGMLRAYPHALCVCEGYVSSHQLSVEAGSSSPGSVAINGDLNTSAALGVTGSLTVAGHGGISASRDTNLVVGGDLRDQGVLSAGVVTVGGDARIGDGIQARELRIEGTLRTPENVEVSVSGVRDVGMRETGVVEIDPPCDCDRVRASAFGDAVRARRNDNDNTRHDLDAFALDGFTGKATWRLGCGHYHVSRIAGGSPLELRIDGNVTLYVDGDVALDDGFRARLSPEAHLRLVVEGNVRVDGPLELPAGDGSGRVDLFVAGSGTLQLGGTTDMTGVLYAPRAELVTHGPVRAGGAIVVQRAAPGADIRLTYDPALARCD